MRLGYLQNRRMQPQENDSSPSFSISGGGYDKDYLLAEEQNKNALRIAKDKMRQDGALAERTDALERYKTDQGLAGTAYTSDNNLRSQWLATIPQLAMTTTEDIEGGMSKQLDMKILNQLRNANLVSPGGVAPQPVGEKTLPATLPSPLPHSPLQPTASQPASQGGVQPATQAMPSPVRTASPPQAFYNPAGSDGWNGRTSKGLAQWQDSAGVLNLSNEPDTYTSNNRPATAQDRVLQDRAFAEAQGQFDRARGIVAPTAANAAATTTKPAPVADTVAVPAADSQPAESPLGGNHPGGNHRSANLTMADKAILASQLLTNPGQGITRVAQRALHGGTVQQDKDNPTLNTTAQDWKRLGPRILNSAGQQGVESVKGVLEAVPDIFRAASGQNHSTQPANQEELATRVAGALTSANPQQAAEQLIQGAKTTEEKRVLLWLLKQYDNGNAR